MRPQMYSYYVYMLMKGEINFNHEVVLKTRENIERV